MDKKKKLQIWLPLLFSITLVFGLFMGYKMRDGMPGRSFFYTEHRKPVQEIMDLIQNRYVDDVNINNISDSGIRAMLAQLDPHSTYIPADQVERINEDLEGSIFGVGIEFNMIADTLHVINVLKAGPADQAGVKTGDKVILANDSVMTGRKLTQAQVSRILRGELNSMVALTIVRGNAKKVIVVKRGIIPITSVDASYMLDKNIGYIRLNRFSSQTYREFMESLTALKKAGLQKLILDLRDNGGGILDQAVEIADEFLAGDKLITYTEGKHTAKKEYRCRREGQFEKGELVVLADEGTASASEILLGALQDWDRATIVGRRSFGKGLVQDQFSLSDNSALRLTIARYFTPIGRSIQRSYAKGGKAYFNDFYNRYTDGELVSADSIKNDTTKIFRTMGGKKVFGGGGISPDYFVAADTTKMDLMTAKLINKGIIVDYGYEYFLLNPDLLSRYKTPAEFVHSFIVSDENWGLFNTMAAKDSINLQLLTPREKSYLISSLKLSIARQLYRTEGYYETLNADDKSIKKAVELLGK